jgi:predicted transcriptional regulator
MLSAMDTMNAATGQAPRPETEAERQDRFAWEAEGLAEARADVTAGRLVDAAKVRAWVDSLRTDNPLPVPYSGR